MNSSQRDKNILVVWNSLVLAFIFLVVVYKSNWTNSAIIAFMVTIGLNLGTYHKYHREFKIPNKLIMLIVISNIFSLLFFLGSTIWLDRVWVMISGILLILLVLVSFVLVFRYSSQKER